MGDPKKIRKKYDTPSHPWIKSRIDEEKILARTFGTRSKKEIWKAETLLKNFKSQAKKLIALSGSQAEIETKHLYRRVKELGLAQQDVDFDTILGLKLENVLGRRLQSILVKKELARSPKQARQFIVHGHVLVEGRKITSPSYLVTVKEESSVGFAVSSPFISDDHPERASKQREQELLASTSQAKKHAQAESKAANKAAQAKSEADEDLYDDIDAGEEQ